MDCQTGGRGSVGDGLVNAPGATGATLQNFEGSKNAANSAPVAAENQHTIEPLALPIAKDPLAIADHPPGGTRLSADAARTLTDQIRRDTTLVYVQLLRAYEGNAHGALGYTSWGAYCEAELQIGRSRSYRLIDAARVAEVVQSPTGDSDTQTITANPAPPALSERVAVSCRHYSAIPMSYDIRTSTLSKLRHATRRGGPRLRRPTFERQSKHDVRFAITRGWRRLP